MARTFNIVSVTLAGGNREGVILDALLSVTNIVDEHLLVWTGPSADTAIERIQFAEKHGELKAPVRVVYYEGVPDKCSAWRNFGLDSVGSDDWALILDTDERVFMGETDIRKILSETASEAVGIWDEKRVYYKFRFIRSSCKTRYERDPHEQFRYENGLVLGRTDKDPFFTELPKTKEQILANALSISKQIQAIPDWDSDPSWLYYYGDAEYILGNTELALAAWKGLANLTENNEVRTWGLFRAAVALSDQQRYQEAKEVIIRGLMCHARGPELFWYAGVLSIEGNDPWSAQAWARAALAQLDEKGLPPPSIPIWPPAHTWGPWNVLAVARDMLGDEEGCLEASDHYFAMGGPEK